MKVLKHLNILYILKSEISETLQTFQEKSNSLIIKENHNEILDVLKDKKIDIIYSEEKIPMNILNSIRQEHRNTHIIICTSFISTQEYFDAITLENILYLREAISKDELKDILLNIVKNIDSSSTNIVQLKDNFIYDNYNNTLLKNKQIISLSKKENSFLNYVIDNKDRAVSYDEINNNLWNGDMTHNALRSVVKEVRRKTYKELIRNISGVGYRVSI
ncbi:winged helix-turn-helix domain-containing protein [Arcobacter roscoffensis]|uniref:Winged helix-turn-helix domain-containing protein n=1 Tax=Arcobacter roscoffensis TaxID=2961520 RepID=A0ABY5E1M2_9BACT|nr:winged helix-turn-helix domain-containing protein [Arcobacter roscoffensis]UTJ05367.1 winged helix-turn-helix domain-containing protein [Arcobacter roscoffensis]